MPVSRALETNKNSKEYAWLAQYRPTEVEDISGCERLAQVSGMSRTRWNSRAHSEVYKCRCLEAKIWTCLSHDEEDQTEQLLPCPRSVYNVYKVLACISGNNHTGCEQCTWITMWIAMTGNCWSRAYWLAFGNVRVPQQVLGIGSLCKLPSWRR
jgi:hypothetical protein